MLATSNQTMKTWDVIVVGGGIIGISIALAVRRLGAMVLIVERGAAGREASHAAAGMLAHCDPHQSPVLHPLAHASARLYPEFVHELEDESGERVDYRTEGTIQLWRSQPGVQQRHEVGVNEKVPQVQREALNLGEGTPVKQLSVPHPEQSEVWGSTIPCPDARVLSGEDLAALEPGLRMTCAEAAYLPEACVAPRALISAAIKAAKHRGIDLASGSEVTRIQIQNQRTVGVRTEKTEFCSAAVVNCGGAWAGQISRLKFPVRPIKGQMLARVVPTAYSEQGSPSSPRILRHVVRTPGVYLVPRSDGRIVIGSTLEDAGYDKRVDADTIRGLDAQARGLLPELAQTRISESWAGLRPATPDGLPILGTTKIRGYFVATGHYRDGILLAPITALVMARVIQGFPPEVDISELSASRFDAER